MCTEARRLKHGLLQGMHIAHTLQLLENASLHIAAHSTIICCTYHISSWSINNTRQGIKNLKHNTGNAKILQIRWNIFLMEYDRSPLFQEYLIDFLYQIWFYCGWNYPQCYMHLWCQLFLKHKTGVQKFAISFQEFPGMSHRLPLQDPVLVLLLFSCSSTHLWAIFLLF